MLASPWQLHNSSITSQCALISSSFSTLQGLCTLLGGPMKQSCPITAAHSRHVASTAPHINICQLSVFMVKLILTLFMPMILVLPESCSSSPAQTGSPSLPFISNGSRSKLLLRKKMKQEQKQFEEHHVETCRIETQAESRSTEQDQKLTLQDKRTNIYIHTQRKMLNTLSRCQDSISSG